MWSSTKYIHAGSGELCVLGYAVSRSDGTYMLDLPLCVGLITLHCAILAVIVDALCPHHASTYIYIHNDPRKENE